MENKKPTCPKCNSKEVIPIIYGKPAKELIERAERGEVKLGGCVRGQMSHFCKDCRHSW